MVNSKEKLLLFGGLPQKYLEEWEITSNLKLVEEKLNVQFEEVPTEELVAKYKSLSGLQQANAEDLARQLINKASKDRRAKPPTEAEIVKATKLYVAIRSIVEERAAEAVTIVCGPWIRDAESPVPCVALTLLQEEGIPAACQGDIDALLTMVLFKRASGLTSFMGGGVKARGHLGVSHCVLSRQMLGSMAPPQPYYIGNYHGRKNSPTIHTKIPKGQLVTIARLTGNLENLILTWGEVVGDQDLKNRCRNTVIIKVRDRATVLRSVRGIQQHLVVACGDLRKAMTEMAKETGVSVIAV